LNSLDARKRACLIFPLLTAALSAQTFTTLVSFDGAHGAAPASVSPVQGLDGNLYGATFQGGANNRGTVFQVTPAGALTTVYSFSGTDGAFPESGLLLATTGNLFGTTFFGGTHGAGTVFKINPAAALTSLYSFTGSAGTEGSNPFAGLVQAAGGNFYGTTAYGGTYNAGTIFKITGNGTLTTVVSFNGANGSYPSAGLIQSNGKILFGTASAGGTKGYGTVFKITPSGRLTTLYNFDLTDGAYPAAGLVQAAAGNLYGTTSGGGARNYGTVFKITPAGKLTTLHTFQGGAEGIYPEAALIQATDGNFYGSTYEGGAHNAGTLFRMTPSGSLTTLYSFSGADGANPEGALLQATDGNFYGATKAGGSSSACLSCGTVFTLSAGLAPFVITLPAFGPVGAAVKILGTNLAGATSVTFNGRPATFTVIAPSEITTTVPAGATTGTVQVVTPAGTLLSQAPFKVQP
jgi:uncharacterized repeat protein (TIGR03803 family)